jgi:hypothetical protein
MFEKFKKKPVTIEAVQLTLENAADVAVECGFAICSVDGDGVPNTDSGKMEVYIDTLEGTMTGIESDWIIRGLKGEYYPCKDDIFKQSYDEVEQ